MHPGASTYGSNQASPRSASGSYEAASEADGRFAQGHRSSLQTFCQSLLGFKPATSSTSSTRHDPLHSVGNVMKIVLAEWREKATVLH